MAAWENDPVVGEAQPAWAKDPVVGVAPWESDPEVDPNSFKDFLKGSVVGNIPAGIVKGGDLALRGLDTAAAAAAGLFGQEAERDRILRESDARSRSTAQFIAENFGQGKAAELGQGLGALPAMINPLTGIPAAVGGVTDIQRTLDEQGVDPQTAAEVAKRQAISNVVTGALPFANVSRLAGAGANVAGGVVGDYFSQKVLQEGGYKEQAAGFNPLDPVQRAIDIAGGFAAPVGKPAKPAKTLKDALTNLDNLDKAKEEQSRTQGEGTLYVGKDGDVTSELPRKITETPEQIEIARAELDRQLQEKATRNVEGQQLEILDENGRVIERQSEIDLQPRVEQPEALAPNLAPAIPEGHTYRVVDPRTGEVMGTYKNISTAMKAVDRLDNEYGAARYRAEKLPETKVGETDTSSMIPSERDARRNRALIDNPRGPGEPMKADLDIRSLQSYDKTSGVFDVRELFSALAKTSTEEFRPYTGILNRLSEIIGAMPENQRPKFAVELLRDQTDMTKVLDTEHIMPMAVAKDPGKGGKFLGNAHYDPNTHTVWFGRRGLTEGTVVHETVHAVTSRLLHMLPRNDPLVADLYTLYNRVKNSAEFKNEYGIGDIHEFLAEAFASPNFQEKLSRIKFKNPDGSTGHGFKSFIKAVAKLLGFSPESKDQISALELVIKRSDKLMETYAKDAQSWNMDFQREFPGYANVPNVLAPSKVAPLLAQLGQKTENKTLPVAKAFDEDAAKAGVIEKLGATHIPEDPKVTPELIQKIAKEEDGSNVWAFTPGALARATLNNSTLVKTVYRLMNNAYKRAELYNRDVVQPVEKTIGKLLQGPKGEILHNILMRELKNGRDYTPEELRAAGISDDVVMAHLEFRNMMEQALNKQNDVLRDKGLPPIKGIDAYISSRWAGPWRANIKDSEGKIIFQIAEQTRGNAKRALEYIKAKNPNLVYEDINYKVGREKGDRIEAGYLDMLKLLDPNDERVATLKSIYEDYVMGRTEDVSAQEKHFLKKTGVKGFAGDRPWSKTDVKDFFVQQFEYAKNAGKWADSQKAMEGVDKLINDPSLQESQKNNIAYAKEYTKNQLGFGTAKVFEGIDNAIAKAFGTSPQELQKYMGGMKTVFYLSKLGLSLPFTITQFLQPAITTPAWHRVLSNEGFEHNPVLSTMGAISGGLSSASWHYSNILGNPITRKAAEALMTPLQRDAAKYMEANGVIDINPLSDIRKNLRHGAVKAIAAPFEFTIKHSEIIARSMAFMSFVDHLESSGKFDTSSQKGRQALFEKAEDMTNLSMTDYRSHERGLVFERGGLTGDAAATLHSYQLNNLMQGVHFLQQAKQGNGLPLFYFVAMQTLAAGLTGLWFVDDLDDLLDNMKKFLPHDQFMKVKDISVKNLILNNTNDFWAYGGVSSLTGTNIHTRMNASNQIPVYPFEPVPQIRSVADALGAAGQQLGSLAPFLGVAGDIVGAGITGASPGATPNEKMQALYPAVPSVAQGPMERLPAFNAGGVSLNPRDLGEGRYRRTEKEKTLRDMGFRSPEEQRFQDRNFALSKIEKQYTSRLTDASKRAKEFFISGNMERSANEAIKYAQLGGDPDTLFAGVDEAVLRKFSTELDRRLKSAETGSYPAAMKLKRYLDAHGYSTNR